MRIDIQLCHGFLSFIKGCSLGGKSSHIISFYIISMKKNIKEGMNVHFSDRQG